MMSQKIINLPEERINWIRSHVRKMFVKDVVNFHFMLDGFISFYYRNRKKDIHYQIALSACEHMVAISDIVMDAMKSTWLFDEMVCRNASKILGVRRTKRPVIYYRPAHHGYYQLGVVLRRNKNFERDVALKEKSKSEGWGCGDIDITNFKSKCFSFNGYEERIHAESFSAQSDIVSVSK